MRSYMVAGCSFIKNNTALQAITVLLQYCIITQAIAKRYAFHANALS